MTKHSAKQKKQMDEFLDEAKLEILNLAKKHGFKEPLSMVLLTALVDEDMIKDSSCTMIGTSDFSGITPAIATNIMKTFDELKMKMTISVVKNMLNKS